MQYIPVDLGLDGSEAQAFGILHDNSLEMPARSQRPCVVVCPGGGYEMVSDREKDPIALAFNAAGYQVFTLTYSVKERARDFQPLIELSRLIMAIRENAGAWSVIPDKIAVIGFSAGGHLAASLGTLWNHPDLRKAMGIAAPDNAPNALILSYPVISAGPNAHQGSLLRISGGDPERAKFFSLENHVGPHTPPTFLWHTEDDPVVPVENTLLFCNALRQHGISFESHIFAHGQHGLSLCNEEVATPNAACAPWVSLCLTWLAGLFGFPS